MSGLLLGIMLARPVSSMVDTYFGWHAIFMISSAMLLVLALVLAKSFRQGACKRRTNIRLSSHPSASAQDNADSAAPRTVSRVLFGMFSLFWTTVPLVLTSPVFHFSSTGVALFALAGVSGAAAAPVLAALQIKA